MSWLRKIEDRLAWIAAIIVLVGISTATENVLAGEKTIDNLEVAANATTSELSAGAR